MVDRAEYKSKTTPSEKRGNDDANTDDANTLVGSSFRYHSQRPVEYGLNVHPLFN